MVPRRGGVARPALAATVLLLLMGAGEGGTPCASIEDAAARLACYDAQARGGTEAPAADAGAGTMPAAPAAPPASPPAAAAPPEMPEWERKERDAFGKPEGLTAQLAARIVGKFTEWERGTLIRLDNGQVWKCVEDKAAIYPRVPENPEVVITRGMLGYSMEIKPLGRRIRVTRVE